MDHRMTRRRFLFGGSAVVVGAAVASTAGVLVSDGVLTRHGQTADAAGSSSPSTASPTPPPAIPPYSGLRTRPDFDGVATLKVRQSTQAAASGPLLLTPKTSAGVQGAALYDNAGHLVWYHPVGAGLDMIHNLQMVTYQGEPMLAWYEGKTPPGTPGFGNGAYLLYNTRYEQVAVIRGEQGSPVDLHEMVITPEGTAFVEAYLSVKKNLEAYGGAKDTTVYDWHLQEIDIATGKLLFSWRSLDHVAIAESVESPPTSPGGSFDYFHGNSIAIAPDGKSLLVSARNTSTLYKIDRTTGEILWRLRGADKGVAPGKTLKLLPEGETFWYQHDARVYADGTISVFDDGGQPFKHNGRGLVLAIDETVGTATIQRDDSMNMPVNYEGSYRPVSNGDWLVGWGDIGGLTEFAPDGSVVLDIDFDANSYRCVRADWSGDPLTPPDIAAGRALDGTVNVWASWNGATRLRSWRLLAGTSVDALAPVGEFPCTDFETAMTVTTAATVVAVAALDADGSVLSTSAARPV